MKFCEQEDDECKEITDKVDKLKLTKPSRQKEYRKSVDEFWEFFRENLHLKVQESHRSLDYYQLVEFEIFLFTTPEITKN